MILFAFFAFFAFAFAIEATTATETGCQCTPLTYTRSLVGTSCVQTQTTGPLQACCTESYVRHECNAQGQYSSSVSCNPGGCEVSYYNGPGCEEPATSPSKCGLTCTKTPYITCNSNGQVIGTATRTVCRRTSDGVLISDDISTTTFVTPPRALAPGETCSYVTPQASEAA
jgi:hypothetical protein